MGTRVNIIVAEPSTILRGGVVAVLHKATNLNINIAEVTEDNLEEQVIALEPDIIIINPTHYGLYPPVRLRELRDSTKIIALQSSLIDISISRKYDETISIYDSAESIISTIVRVIESCEDIEARTELSQREKEIVVCVAKGLSNKEIAEELFLSPHTVIAHRRNITSKLDIYSASGLTIYAIVNKLIDIESLPAK